MTQNNALIRFLENGIIQELKSTVQHLKKEDNQEILYTHCGKRIAMESIQSFNGILFF